MYLSSKHEHCLGQLHFQDKKKFSKVVYYIGHTFTLHPWFLFLKSERVFVFDVNLNRYHMFFGLLLTTRDKLSRMTSLEENTKPKNKFMITQLTHFASCNWLKIAVLISKKAYFHYSLLAYVKFKLFLSLAQFFVNFILTHPITSTNGDLINLFQSIVQIRL